MLLRFGLISSIFAFTAALSFCLNYISPDVHVIYTEQNLMILLQLLTGFCNLLLPAAGRSIMGIVVWYEKAQTSVKTLHKSGVRQEFVLFMNTNSELQNKVTFKVQQPS